MHYKKWQQDLYSIWSMMILQQCSNDDPNRPKLGGLPFKNFFNIILWNLNWNSECPKSSDRKTGCLTGLCSSSVWVQPKGEKRMIMIGEQAEPLGCYAYMQDITHMKTQKEFPHLMQRFPYFPHMISDFSSRYFTPWASWSKDQEIAMQHSFTISKTIKTHWHHIIQLQNETKNELKPKTSFGYCFLSVILCWSNQLVLKKV